MKNFIKRVNWKKFWKYEFWFCVVTAALYYISVIQGVNIFPQNFYVIFVVPAIFAFMILIRAFSDYQHQKLNKKNK